MGKKIKYRVSFPSAKDTFNFAPKSIRDISKECLVVLDTNVLSLPYSTSARSLKGIENFYTKLKVEGRLFVPSHAIREFITLRPVKITELVEKLTAAGNFNPSLVTGIPFLEEITEYKAVAKSAEDLITLSEGYRKQVKALRKKIESFGWDDPVTVMYRSAIDTCILAEPTDKDDEIFEELKERMELQMPPGYKDSKKEINAEGDLIIWKEILLLGKNKKKDLIFVTGEEKSDWWHAGGPQRIYPRSELVDEYRRISEGKTFQIASLSTLMDLFGEDEQVVNEVKESETVQEVKVTNEAVGMSDNFGIPTLAQDKKNGSFLFPYRGGWYPVEYYKYRNYKVIHVLVLIKYNTLYGALQFNLKFSIMDKTYYREQVEDTEEQSLTDELALYLQSQNIV